MFSPFITASEKIDHNKHGLIFRQPCDLITEHPYLEGININFLPVYSDKEVPVPFSELDTSYNVLVENEYVTHYSGEKKLATLGIYNCVVVVIPSIHTFMHIYDKTDLKSVLEILEPHISHSLLLYTCSL